MNKELGSIGSDTLQLLREMDAKAIKGGRGMNFSSTLYPEHGLVVLEPGTISDKVWLGARANALRRLSELAQDIPSVRVPEVLFKDPEYLLLEMAQGISLYQGTYTPEYLVQHAQIPTNVKLNLLHSYFEVVEAANTSGIGIVDHKSDSVFIEWDPNSLSAGRLWIVDPGGIQRIHPDLKNASPDKLRGSEICGPYNHGLNRNEVAAFIESFFISGYSTTEEGFNKYRDAIPWQIKKACFGIMDGTINSTSDLWPYLDNIPAAHIGEADEIRKWYLQKISSNLLQNTVSVSDNHEEQSGLPEVTLESLLHNLEDLDPGKKSEYRGMFLEILIDLIQEEEGIIDYGVKQRIIEVFRRWTNTII